MKKYLYLIIGLLVFLISFIFLFKDKFNVEVNTNSKIEDSYTFTTYLKKDKLVVVNYWASWCEPCLEEIPFLNNLKRKYDGEVAFLSFSKDKDSTLTKQSKEKHKFEWDEITLIDYQFKHSLNSFFKQNKTIEIDELPLTLFIKNGKVLDEMSGEVDSVKVYRLIETYK